MPERSLNNLDNNVTYSHFSEKLKFQKKIEK